jgi:hypothetical protein
MSRYERRMYFERLCELRAGYGERGTDDSTSAIAIEAMIERAIDLLEAPGAPLIEVTDGASKD